jgi:Polyketide cyclase / dehydrase and lipid transport
MFTADASIHLSIRPQWVWMHASKPDFLGFIPSVSAVKKMGSNRFAVRIDGLWDDGSCVMKTSLREPPRRIAWHSVGGILHLRAEIMIEGEGTGSRLTVQLYALPRDAQLSALPCLERALKKISETLKGALERFAARFEPAMALSY